MQPTPMRAGAATALALVLAAGAAADPTGYVGASVSNTDLEVGAADTDFAGYRLDAGYNNNLSGDLDLQANIAFNYFDTDPSEVDGWNGDLHLVNRTMGGALGGFVSYYDSDAAEGVWGLGAEGEVYQERTTFGGVVGVFEADDVDSLWGACGYGRLYSSRNFAIEGRGTYADVDFGGGADTSALGLGASAEYQFAGSPFSLAGGLDYYDLDDFNVEATTLSLRARLHFGTSDLQERDREGAGSRGSYCITSLTTF